MKQSKKKKRKQFRKCKTELYKNKKKVFKKSYKKIRKSGGQSSVPTQTDDIDLKINSWNMEGLCHDILKYGGMDITLQSDTIQKYLRKSLENDNNPDILACQELFLKRELEISGGSTWNEEEYCEICGVFFSTFTRRHHCRICGISVCDKHSKNQINGVRVCDICYQLYENNGIQPIKYNKKIQDKLTGIIFGSKTGTLVDVEIDNIQKEIINSLDSDEVICYQFINNRANTLIQYLNNTKLKFIYDGYTGGIFYDSSKFKPSEIKTVNRRDELDGRLEKAKNYLKTAMETGKQSKITSAQKDVDDIINRIINANEPKKTCLIVKFIHNTKHNSFWVVNIHLKAKTNPLTSSNTINTKHIKELENIFTNMKEWGWNENEHTILLGDFNNTESKELLLQSALTNVNLNPAYLKEICCQGQFTQHAIYMDCEDNLHTLAGKACNIPGNDSEVCNHSYDSIMHYGNQNIEIKNGDDVVQQDPADPASDHDMIRSQVILSI